MYRLFVSLLLLVGVSQNFAHASNAKLSFGEAKLSYQHHAEMLLEINLKPGWHTYWHNAGNAGMAPQLEFSANNIGHVHWNLPTPSRIIRNNIISFGYENYISIPIVITPQNHSDNLSGVLELTLIACNSQCRIETVKLPFSIFPNALTGPDNYSQPELQYEKLSAIINTNQLEDRILFEADELPKDLKDIFIHINSKNFAYDAPKLVSYNKKLYWQLELRTSLTPPRVADKMDIIVATKSYAKKYSGKIASATSFASEDSSPKWLYTLMAAFIGGVILNFMPCVLPVLSLKMLALVKMKKLERSASNIKREFCFTILGILSGFWVLATIVSVFNYVGVYYSWGSQFQSSWFLALVILVLTFVALNLLDLMSLTLPAKLNNYLYKWVYNQRHDVAAFSTGVLAMVLATPCTAPFLTSALAATINTNISFTFITMTTIGLGLALPYILALLHPNIMRYLPKPGKWMITLRRILALGVFISVFWLGSLLFNKTFPAVVIKEDKIWHQFEPEIIPQLIAEGRVVVVDITADWCLICQFNHATVFTRSRILQKLTSPQVYAMRGDFSNYNAKIEDFLSRYKRSGIPFNVIFSPQYPEGVILPELLSEQDVIKNIQSR